LRRNKRTVGKVRNGRKRRDEKERKNKSK
jgi:hypothetical protein